MGLAGVLEFGGGLLIVLGLFTRPVALVLMLEMLGAFFIAHFPRGGWPIENGGELPLLFALVWGVLRDAWCGAVQPGRAAGRTAVARAR